MDDRTSPNRASPGGADDTTPMRPGMGGRAGDTSPTRPGSGGQASATVPRRAVKRPAPARPRRRSRAWGWRLLALVLTGIVAANVCATSGVWMYYYAFAGADTTPPPGSPPPQVAALLTAIPPLQETPAPTATVNPFPTVAPEPVHGVVSILLLGVDERPDQVGEPTRTDTMMVLRADFDNGTARLLSFPRDMWVALPNLEAYGYTANRINTAYFFGERYDLPGGGPALAMETVTLNFGVRLDHYALVNFNGFVKSVDALGGIDIDVPEPIYDAQFPTDDYGTIVFSVPAGLQHMDGITALRYARTRHQDNDFERARRQQAVMLAIRDKAVTLDAVTKMPELISIAGDSFRTDMTLPQMASYAIGRELPHRLARGGRGQPVHPRPPENRRAHRAIPAALILPRQSVNRPVVIHHV
jgi:LCP family protein required for cell wall assembly